MQQLPFSGLFGHYQSITSEDEVVAKTAADLEPCFQIRNIPVRPPPNRFQALHEQTKCMLGICLSDRTEFPLPEGIFIEYFSYRTIVGEDMHLTAEFAPERVRISDRWLAYGGVSDMRYRDMTPYPVFLDKSDPRAFRRRFDIANQQHVVFGIGCYAPA